MSSDEDKKKQAALFGSDDDDESSDDDASAGGGDEEGAAKKGVPMKGDVVLTEGRLFWSGLWADSEEEFAAGKTKKFKYGGPTGGADALAAPPAGNWNGYFFNPGDDGDVKVKEKGIKLSFAAGGGDVLAVSGGGENEFGEFSLKGSYDVAAKKLVCRKAYLFSAEGDSDDDEIDSDAADENVAEEIAGLEDDANVDIEVLRARYAAMEEAALREEAGAPPAKKARAE